MFTSLVGRKKLVFGVVFVVLMDFVVPDKAVMISSTVNTIKRRSLKTCGRILTLVSA